MNTDKIDAEQLANEYAPKDTSKVIALRKLDFGISYNGVYVNPCLYVNL